MHLVAGESVSEGAGAMGRVFRRLAVLTFGLVLVWMLGTAVPGLAAPSDKAQPSAQGQANGQAANAQGNGQANGQAATAQGNGQSSGNGANVSGPYDPSGVGEPSGNGRSTDNNGKRPCAGCVGNADSKNPPGQLPGGSDPNKGYECDENQGVGKTNPAHSGCGTSTSVTPPGGGPPGGGPPGGGPPGGGPPGDNPPGGGPAGGPGGVAGIQTTSPP